MENRLKLSNKDPFLYNRIMYLLFLLLIPVLAGYSQVLKTNQNLAKWKFQSQRVEISPSHWIDENILFDGASTLAMAGNDKEYSNGSWSRTFDVIPGRYFSFITHFKSVKLNQVDRSAFAQITWHSSDGQLVGFTEFPGSEAKQLKDNWFRIQQTYLIPNNAVKGKVDLVYRWDADGSVYYGGTSFKETESIPSRKVRLATIHHRPRNTSSPKENLLQFKSFIDTAGQQEADVVCLPEGITVVGTNKTYLEVSETIPGPTTKFLGELAKKYEMYIIAGIYEKDGPVVYNSSVLIGRDGNLAGKYRKVFLPQEEIAAGLTPGNSFPVFDTDFGKIGMMICWDAQFPEAARKLALSGAEILFFPVWGGDITLVKARAIENQVFIVSSSYDMESGIFNQNGELISEGTEENPVAIFDIDLNKRNLIPWLGEFKNRIKREMPKTKTITY